MATQWNFGEVILDNRYRNQAMDLQRQQLAEKIRAAQALGDYRKGVALGEIGGEPTVEAKAQQALSDYRNQMEARLDTQLAHNMKMDIDRFGEAKREFNKTLELRQRAQTTGEKQWESQFNEGKRRWEKEYDTNWDMFEQNLDWQQEQFYYRSPLQQMRDLWEMQKIQEASMPLPSGGISPIPTEEVFPVEPGDTELAKHLLSIPIAAGTGAAGGAAATAWTGPGAGPGAALGFGLGGIYGIGRALLGIAVNAFNRGKAKEGFEAGEAWLDTIESQLPAIQVKGPQHPVTLQAITSLIKFSNMLKEYDMKEARKLSQRTNAIIAALGGSTTTITTPQ